VLKSVFELVKLICGSDTAKMISALCLYPTEQQVLRSELYTEDGGVLTITKQQQSMVVWPLLSKETIPQFDTFVIKTVKNRPRHVIGCANPILGQDLRCYTVLPQLLHGNAAVWTEMQQLFTYPNTATITEDSKKRIREYIQVATNSSDCLVSANLHDNIQAFNDWYRPRANKKRKCCNHVPKQWTEELILQLQANHFIAAFQSIAQYCHHNGLPNRVLSAIGKSSTALLADGCLFSFDYEEMVLCQYAIENNGWLQPLSSQWEIVLLQNGVMNRVSENGIEYDSEKGEALLLATSQNHRIPQMQLIVNGRFVKPRFFWQIWRQWCSGQQFYESKPLLALVKRLYPLSDAITTTDPVQFLQTLFAHINHPDALSV
jgi:hypothetical protein